MLPLMSSSIRIESDIWQRKKFRKLRGNFFLSIWEGDLKVRCNYAADVWDFQPAVRFQRFVREIFVNWWNFPCRLPAQQAIKIVHKQTFDPPGNLTDLSPSRLEVVGGSPVGQKKNCLFFFLFACVCTRSHAVWAAQLLALFSLCSFYTDCGFLEGPNTAFEMNCCWNDVPFFLAGEQHCGAIPRKQLCSHVFERERERGGHKGLSCDTYLQ